MKKYIVRLTPEERFALEEIINKGKAAAQKILHARILLKADESNIGPNWIDEKISDALDISTRTIERIRKRFVMEGLDSSLCRKKQKNRKKRIIDGDTEAHLIALSCSKAPEGRSKWTLQLLADKMIELKYVDTVSRETIRISLKKTNLNPG